jgi:uncharacterized protein
MQSGDLRRGELVKSLASFFTLTFAVTSVAFFALGGLPPESASTVTVELILLPGTIAPALVALVLTYRAAGREGLRRLFRRVTHWDVPARWYVFALGYITAVRLGAALLERLTSGAWPDFSDSALLLPFAIVLSTPVQAGEEIGWRGYALPRLTALLGLGRASVLLGLIWAAWHLPLFYIPAARHQDQSFIVYTLFVTGVSVAMAWLWRNTQGSVLLAMVMHSTVNQTQRLVSPATIAPAGRWSLDAPPLAWFVVALLWVGAVYFLVRLSKMRDTVTSARAAAPTPSR